ncbi:MAG: hypothetical protein LQ352_008009 [Teloschistes flavicans]|nr:MAG: hypothetical protein LQ352_008009 [Teloschistes flavicans]
MEQTGMKIRMSRKAAPHTYHATKSANSACAVATETTNADQTAFARVLTQYGERADDQGNQSGQDVSPTPGPDNGTPAGAIAGGVVGGVVVLALLAGAIIFFRRRAKKDRQTHQQSYTAGPNAHYQSPHAEMGSRAMSEAPQYGNKEPAKIRSEAAGTERYEIGTPAKEKTGTQELE